MVKVLTHTLPTQHVLLLVCVLVPARLWEGPGATVMFFSHDVNLMCVHSISLYVRTLNNDDEKVG